MVAIVTIGHLSCLSVLPATARAIPAEAPMTGMQKNQARRMAVPAALSPLKL